MLSIIKNYRYETLKKKGYKERILKDIGLESNMHSEVHHIIPKCCGGTDDPNNLVILFNDVNNHEHLLAHDYLSKSTSLFLSNKVKLIIAFNYMLDLSGNSTKRVKLPENSSPIKGIKVSKETLDKRLESNKKAIKIAYKGEIYRSARELSREKMFDGKLHSSQTIIRWADMKINGLEIIDLGNIHKSIKNIFDPDYRLNSSTRAIKILYNNIVYRSARELVRSNINSEFKSEATILNWARKGKIKYI